MAEEKDVVVVEPAAVAERPDEPPVVARLVVEIRSDGTRTIARGALQDAVAGHEVAVKAEGTTPLSLALSLASAMLKVPSIGRAFASRLLRKKER